MRLKILESLLKEECNTDISYIPGTTLPFILLKALLSTAANMFHLTGHFEVAIERLATQHIQGSVRGKLVALEGFRFQGGSDLIKCQCLVNLRNQCRSLVIKLSKILTKN